MNSPPKQMRDSMACDLTDAFIQGIDTARHAGEQTIQTTAGE